MPCSIRQWVCVAAATVAFVGFTALPGHGVCFPDVPIPGWVAGDLGPLPMAGASRPLPVDRIELCSASPGFATFSDGDRYLVRRYDGDAVFTATLESIDDQGLGGLVVRRDERSPNAAYVRITAHLRRDGTALLRSAVRLSAGGAADDMGAVPMVVELPLQLRIERSGTKVSTWFAEPGDPFTAHLSVDTAGADLDTNPLVYGMVQASEDLDATASAIFGEPQFGVPHDPPPDLSSCVDGFVTPTTGGHPITVRGDFLDRATGAHIAGVPARIVAQTRSALVLEPGPHREGVASGEIVLDSSRGPVALRQRVVYAGEPFVRGDLTGDGRVGLSDLLVLSRFLTGHGELACREAADVNADRRIDGHDVSRLLLFLLLGRPPLPAPFPRPGFAPSGGFSCGQPPAPRLTSVRDAHGRRLSTQARLREGDEIVLEGSGFPSDPARALVSFGNVPAEVLAGGDADLRVRIGTVPTAGRKCPVVLFDTALIPIPEPLRGEVGTLNRLGVAFGVPPEVNRPDLCPRFEPSRLAQVASARLLPRQSALFLPFDRATWNPSDPLHVDVRLYLPLVDGLSRGSRVVRFSYLDPVQRLQRAGSVPYDEWLKRLAGRLTLELNGADPDDCGGCDAEAEADPDAGGIVIKPCDPVLTWTFPPNGGDPPPPPFEFPLKAPPPPLWGADWFKTIVNCAAPGDPDSSPRKFMWCNFAELIQPHPQSGLPLWEYYFPAQYLHTAPGTYALPSLANLPDPPDRSPADKAIMFHPAAYADAVDNGYVDACAIAARAYYCAGTGNSDWMPAFSLAARVVKTFWLTEGQLPLHADPDDYYSYQPPQGGRRYLGGMHMAVGNGQSLSGGYFDWATFFVPKPPGDDTTKDGSPLSFNPSCSVGGLADRPMEITGVWEHYVLCTDSAPGEASCGNPWGPSNECQALSCNQCHVQLGSVAKNYPPLPEIAVAWLPTFATNSVSECLEEIEDSGGTAYSWFAPAECQ